jgi:4'-phosphopantetheinyl transferase
MIVDALAQSLPSGVQVQGATYTPTHREQWRAWLSEEEQALLSSFGAETRQHEFLAGRAAARQLLGACLDVPPADVPLRRAEDDAVDVVGADWQVSIAHSGGHALAAAARHAIGADLEHIQSRDPAIVDFLFPPEERGCVDALPYAFDAALVLCWTLKEAVLKARRSGFRRSPKDLHLAVEPEAGIATVRVRQGRTWRVYYMRLDDYWRAVAVPQATVSDEGG